MNKPSFPRWTNPYIDKVETLPDYLAPAFAGAPSEQELTGFAKKKETFHSVFCEFGCGSGNHLVEQAGRIPDGLFVGFELRYKRAFRAAQKAKRKGLENFFVFRANVSSVEKLFSAGSLDGVFVNFPDPWDKKRWEENLMLNTKMILCLEGLLKKKAFIAYKTDHFERFRQVKKMFEACPAFEIECSTEDLYAELPADNIPTEFEGLFRSKGLPICRLIARRK